jgi:hypothetical protein
MVRFSDMLGGSGEPEDGRAASSPFAELADDGPDPEGLDGPAGQAEGEADHSEADHSEADLDAEPEPVAAPDSESPEAVLERLMRYATSARAADQAPSVGTTEPEGASDDELAPEGDDFLPHSRGVIPRPSWGRKRRP